MSFDLVGLLAQLSDPRLAMLAAGAPTVASGIWIVIQHRAQVRAKNEATVLTREQMRVAELDKMQSSFSAEQMRWVTDLRSENRDLRGDLIETRRDRDRGWDLARWWHNAAHETLQAFRALRHNAVGMAQWIESAKRLQPTLDVPSAIEPVPPAMTLPFGLEDTDA